MRSWLLATSLFLLPIAAHSHDASTGTYARTDHYSVEFDDLKWYHKAGMILLGLDWETVSIQTTFSRDEQGNEKVISVCAWADDTDIEDPPESYLFFQLNQSTAAKTSFLYFIKKTKFNDTEILPLLDLYNYLYDLREQDMKFDSQNLFEKENGTMHSKFSKKKSADGSEVAIRTLNSSGTENGWVDVTMKLSPQKHLEKISAKLKIGVKFTLTIEKDD